MQQDEDLNHNSSEENFLEEGVVDEVIDDVEIDIPVEGGEVEESLAMLHSLELERDGSENDIYEFFINEDEEIDGEY